jgi:hypothetical protein
VIKVAGISYYGYKAQVSTSDPTRLSHFSRYFPLFNTSKPLLFKIIFKNLVRTAKKTQLFTVEEINRLTLFKKIIAVYSENRTKHIHKNADSAVANWI